MSRQPTQAGAQSKRTSTDRGVSPVVGVVLMIVLAVSLTVVVGGFTSDLVDQASVKSAPQATLNVYNNGQGQGIRVAHDGGEDLDFAAVTVAVREVNGASLGEGNLTISEAPEEFSPGDTFVVNSSKLAEGTEYEVLLIDDDSGKVIDDGVVEYRR